MKRVILTSLIIMMVLGIGLTFADKPLGEDGYNGNGAPSGPHFNLNLIGVPKEKTADMNGGGHVIFVPLEGNVRILLTEGDFAVLDKNGTDGKASFQLPNPDADNDGVTTYSVFARALGTPGGSGSMVTGGVTDPGPDGIVGTDDDVIVYSIMVLELERTHGKQKFENVSKELLYVYADIDADGDLDRVPLFDDALLGYLWDYNNDGLKVVQLRFYMLPTDVSGELPEIEP